MTNYNAGLFKKWMNDNLYSCIFYDKINFQRFFFQGFQEFFNSIFQEFFKGQLIYNDGFFKNKIFSRNNWSTNLAFNIFFFFSRTNWPINLVFLIILIQGPNNHGYFKKIFYRVFLNNLRINYYLEFIKNNFSRTIFFKDHLAYILEF